MIGLRRCKPLAIGTDGDVAAAIAQCHLLLLHILGLAPDLDDAVTTRCQQITLRIKRQRLHQIKMRIARLLIEARLHQRGIGQPSDQRLRGHVVDENLIGAASRNILTIRRNSDRINRIQSGRQRLPDDGRLAKNHFALGTLIDPEFDESQFIGLEIGRVGLVVLGRHRRLGLVGSQLQQQTLAALARHHRRARLATDENCLGRFKDEIAFRICLVVTGGAALFEEWQNLFLKIDSGRSLELGNSNRPGDSGLGLFREGDGGKGAQGCGT